MEVGIPTSAEDQSPGLGSGEAASDVPWEGCSGTLLATDPTFFPRGYQGPSWLFPRCPVGSAEPAAWILGNWDS